MKRIFAYSVVGAAGLVVLATAGVFVWLRGTLPDYAKTLESDALGATVTIERDENGVPHIRAESFDDAAFAMGYVQAQDRLWQMEAVRRAVHGNTAAVFGEAFVYTDLSYKAIYRLPHVWEKSHARLDSQTRRAFGAFAAGVNLAIESGEGMSSPEWGVLGVRPKPWSAADVNNMMTVISETATDGARELSLALHDSVFSEEELALLYEELPAAFPTLYSDADEAVGVSAAQGDIHSDPKTPGSNFFVVGPERSATGKPILAADPHLPTYAPAMTYPVIVTLPDDVIAGAAWVGAPAVAFGHNSKIAWAKTHMYADTMDYVVEKIDPDNPDHYLTPDGSEPFTWREYSVDVKGGEPRIFAVRETRNGVVVSDSHLYADEKGNLASQFSIVEELFGPGHVVARRQVNTLEGQLTIQSTMKLSRAHNWNEFRDALRDYEWTNNIIYADVEGNIGVHMAARLPRRREVNGWNGERLARGWLGEGVWDGYVPFDDLAFVFNPPKGWIADANSRAVGPDFPFRVTSNFSGPWRVQRAYDLLGARAAHTPESLEIIQLDVYSAQAEWLMRRVAAFEFRSDRARSAYDMLNAWDFNMDKDRPEPLIYSAFELALQQRLVNSRHDSIGARHAKPLLLARILQADHPWCDKRETPPVESCADAVNEAMELAVERISARHGANMDAWRWGDVHQAVFPAFFSWANVPLLGDFTAAAAPTDGGPTTLNVAASNRSGAPLDDLLSGLQFNQAHGATFRMVVDMADLENSRFMIAPGVSGNAMSPHWADQIDAWAAGDYFRFLGREPLRKQTTVITAKR